jgi:beta-galactosidase
VPTHFRNRGVPIATLCLLTLPAIRTAFAAPAEAIPISGARRVNIDGGWRFFKGAAEGAERPDFDDSQWRQLSLPHDWAIEGPFDSKLNPHTGALPIFGTGWYRKAFTIPPTGKGRYFAVEFDGAMANSRVWINGKELGGRPFGYIGFGFDLTPYLHFGAEANVLAVRLTPEDRSSRWYPGAGIYRNVWMDITAPVHVARWGTYVTTPEVADDKSSVAVKTEIRNQSGQAAKLVLQTSVLDPAGKLVSRNSNDADIPAGGTQTMATTLTVANPQRWDTEHPYLYTVVSEVMDGKRVVDRYTTPFGIRTIAFDKDKGFLLNGRYLKIQGVCNHSDLGALGAAVNVRATQRQLEIMKGAGANAIRTSHNPPSPELLELCDRMGLMVMDESFDMWRVSKIPNGNGYSKYFDEWSERDVRDLVRRDRNHPSIIMYSIGNEIPEQGRADGWQEAKRLTGFFHQEDPTRPTTSAFNNWAAAIKNKLADEVDVPGFNYAPMHYEQILKDHPNWVIYGSETASCVSSRGVYHLPIEKYEKHPSLQISSYDIIAPPWAYCPDEDFAEQDKLPQVLGEFVWTGFDYIGEPTPYVQGRITPEEWPARSSYFGMVDLAGFPKDRYYLYQSQWTKKPMVHVLPHWNWQGREGQPIPVMAYTNADEVELFLNGESLGRKKRFSEPVALPVGPNVSPDRKLMSKYRLEWQVPYRPGDLKAVAYQNGKQVAVDEVRTAGAPARVKITPDHTSILADGDDLSFVTVRIEDRDGNLCPSADNLVHFNLTGVGTIAAVDNGNAATEEPFQADHRKAFSGMALLIVRSKSGQAGRIHIAATSDGLTAAAADVTTHSGGSGQSRK